MEWVRLLPSGLKRKQAGYSRLLICVQTLATLQSLLHEAPFYWLAHICVSALKVLGFHTGNKKPRL